jgi:murein DD-endopeptidase MepM/ murein hydrolase activator NlpD
MKKIPGKIRWLISFVVLIMILGLTAVLLKDFLIYPLARPIKPSNPTIEYGIVTDSLSVVHDRILAGQNLATLLASLNVAPEHLNKLELKTRNILDLRKVKAGNEYTAMFLTGNNKELQYFIYEVSDTNYVVFDFRDSLHVHPGLKEVTAHLKSVTGTINTSLWNTIEEAKADPNLALELSQVYQWTIDFYAIQKGDQFKVIFEALEVDGKPISTGIIHSAWFLHQGKEYYAFRYNQNGVNEYFNENGENLRKEFLKAPLKFSRISSRFSHSRLHPVLRIRRPHYGVDYAAPSGTPVHTIGDGTVIKASYAGGAGRIVSIKHDNNYSTSYMHLAGFGPGVRAGSRVRQGQVIGYVGSSGLSTGPHLDYRVYRNGQPVDPLKVESPPAYPVAAKYRREFDSISGLYIKNLRLIDDH